MKAKNSNNKEGLEQKKKRTYQFEVGIAVISNLKITLQDLCIFCLTLEHKHANEKNKICDVDQETRMEKGEGMKRRMRNADKLEKKKNYILQAI